MKELGLVHIYTGNGKGKTTAAFGLALRAWGRGKRVCIVQFMKRGESYGEVQAIDRLDGIEIRQFGRGRFIVKGKASEEDVLSAKEGFEFARAVLSSGEYDVVVMDEICITIDFDILSSGEVIDALNGRREGVEVVMTGRNAPQELIEMADYVTEMVPIKHPFEKGINARKGVEY
jgi:cob(I)alamin adenosyltransferase